MDAANQQGEVMRYAKGLSRTARLSADQVRGMLAELLEVPISQRDLARAIGISPAFLCDVLKERREPSGPILSFLGLERVVAYRRKD